MTNEIDLTDRATLMRTLPHGGRVVEVGVEVGLFARVILEENQPRELFLVDAWAHQPGTGWEAGDPSARFDLDENFRQVTELFSADPRVTIVRALSVDAAATFEDGSLDIVYIDADHTRAGEDMRAWWPKVRPGGWLCGHDYTDGMYKWITVKADVDQWISETGLPLALTRDLWTSWVVRKPEGSANNRASDIALVVTVYPPQAHLLDGCMQAVEIFWPGHPILTIGQDTHSGIAERLLADLRTVDTEYVVTMHEDYHLSAPVKQDLFDLCLKTMRADPLLVSCSLTWEAPDVPPGHSRKRRYTDHRFQSLPNAWDYVINFQMRIWRRDLLMQILADVPAGTTNAELEPLTTAIYRRKFPQHRAITYAIPNPPVLSWFVDSTDKSQWIIAYDNIVHAGQRRHFPTPIFINNFNRLSTTRRMVECLRGIPDAEIIIVDNASTYAPLLEWYKTNPCEVIRLKDNRGKLAPWTLADRRMKELCYVVTDSDLDLTGVPSDVLPLLWQGLKKYPRMVKAGLSLRIDDLPAAFESTAEIVRWESQFWKRKLDDCWWVADIDTTFALYRPGTGHAYTPAIRADVPYTARHLPWYRTDTAEERYYESSLTPTARTYTTWSGWTLPDDQRPAYQALKKAMP
jgi:hypothetical protein